MTALGLLIAIVLGGIGVLLVERLVAGFRVRGGFADAMVIGGVYGLLKYLLGGVLIVLSLPLVVVTLGLFILVINASLLWLTDKLLTRLEIRSIRALLLSAVLLSIVDFIFGSMLGYGGLY